jgi:hypothetical protein
MRAFSRAAIQALMLAILVVARSSGQVPTPGQVDGGGGARATKQTRPPDNRRPRGTAVGLLGWKAGIRSDAFGAIPFSEAAARIDAAGVAFVEGVGTNLPYTLGTEELDRVKTTLPARSSCLLTARVAAADGCPGASCSTLRKCSKLSSFSRAKRVISRHRGRRRRRAGISTEPPCGANLHGAAKAAPFLLSRAGGIS